MQGVRNTGIELPVVLTQAEVKASLTHVQTAPAPYGLILQLLYGAGTLLLPTHGMRLLTDEYHLLKPSLLPPTFVNPASWFACLAFARFA